MNWKQEAVDKLRQLEAKETALRTIPEEIARVWNRTIKPADREIYREIYGWQANPWVWVIEFEAAMAALKGEAYGG